MIRHRSASQRGISQTFYDERMNSEKNRFEVESDIVQLKTKKATDLEQPRAAVDKKATHSNEPLMEIEGKKEELNNAIKEIEI